MFDQSIDSKIRPWTRGFSFQNLCYVRKNRVWFNVIWNEVENESKTSKEVKNYGLVHCRGRVHAQNGRARAERQKFSGLGATAALFTRGRAVNSVMCSNFFFFFFFWKNFRFFSTSFVKEVLSKSKSNYFLKIQESNKIKFSNAFVTSSSFLFISNLLI